jgi:hypothetical protein
MRVLLVAEYKLSGPWSIIALNISTDAWEVVDIFAIYYVYGNNGYIRFCGYISMKKIILAIIFAMGLVPFASAAQLDAAILANEKTMEPSFEFLRVIYIEYPNDGDIADTLRGQKQTVSFAADSTTSGMNEFVAQLNENLQSTSSNAVISDAKINYQATLQGNQNNAVIEYKLQVVPTILNHVLSQETEKSIVDANWRGISISNPVMIQTEYGQFDINNPRSALDAMIPDVSEKLNGVSIVSIPLIDASGIMKLPLHKWHSLFDNTAIIQGAVEYKFTGKYVITHYSMGECNIGIGTCEDRKWVEDIDLDKKYTIRIIESRDDATIAIEGYADSSKIGNVDVFYTNLKTLVSQSQEEPEFPATIMYGMAGLAAVGAVAMLVISDRKLKNDKNEGQTGVDPAHLRAYQTSNSSGGYKTNRGESYLIPHEQSKTAV